MRTESPSPQSAAHRSSRLSRRPAACIPPPVPSASADPSPGPGPASSSQRWSAAPSCRPARRSPGWIAGLQSRFLTPLALDLQASRGSGAPRQPACPPVLGRGSRASRTEAQKGDGQWPTELPELQASWRAAWWQVLGRPEASAEVRSHPATAAWPARQRRLLDSVAWPPEVPARGRSHPDTGLEP